MVLAASAAAGYLFCKNIPSTISRGTSRIDPRAVWLSMTAGVALLIVLRILALQMPHTLSALADIFYRTGALVFGGGHVVLPLLHDALVPSGWISDSDFLSGYGAAQALPGPLFSVAAYLGAQSAPQGTPLLGASIAVLCIFLPGMLLAVAGRYVWNHGARLPRVRAALAGVNAGAVGILAAALYNPVLTGAMSVVR
jgi:chromate transporter